jgi:hypothetical protein
MTHLDVSTAPVSGLAIAPPAVAQYQSADEPNRSTSFAMSRSIMNSRVPDIC